jgi:hypothetical protein
MILAPNMGPILKTIMPSNVEKSSHPISIEPSVIDLAGGKWEGIERVAVYNTTENTYHEIWLGLLCPLNMSPEQLLITIKNPEFFWGGISPNGKVVAFYGHNNRGEKLIYVILYELGPKRQCIFDIKNLGSTNLKIYLKINKFTNKQPQIMEETNGETRKVKTRLSVPTDGFIIEKGFECPISKEAL